jgi:hypothetical protein
MFVRACTCASGNTTDAICDDASGLGSKGWEGGGGGISSRPSMMTLEKRMKEVKQRGTMHAPASMRDVALLLNEGRPDLRMICDWNSGSRYLWSPAMQLISDGVKSQKQGCESPDQTADIFIVEQDHRGRFQTHTRGLGSLQQSDAVARVHLLAPQKCISTQVLACERQCAHTCSAERLRGTCCHYRHREAPCALRPPWPRNFFLY